MNSEGQGGKVWLPCYGSNQRCNDVCHLQNANVGTTYTIMTFLSKAVTSLLAAGYELRATCLCAKDEQRRNDFCLVLTVRY